MALIVLRTFVGIGYLLYRVSVGQIECVTTVLYDACEWEWGVGLQLLRPSCQFEPGCLSLPTHSYSPTGSGSVAFLPNLPLTPSFASLSSLHSRSQVAGTHRLL